MALRPWTFLVFLLTLGALSVPAEAAKKKEKHKQPKARDVFFYSTVHAPPMNNYLRDVMDSADMIGYVGKYISTILSKKRYLPSNYQLVTNRLKYKPEYGYLEVTTDVGISKPDRHTFIFEVKMTGTFYVSKGGKKIKSFKGKAKKMVKERFRNGLMDTVAEAFKPMEEQLPPYQEFE